MANVAAMRRIRVLLVLALLGAGVASFAPPVHAEEGTCGGGTVEVRGRVTDAATGLPLEETTSVEIAGVTIKFADGDGTDAASRWVTCLDPATYRVKFVADSYRPEWYHDQPNFSSGTNVVVSGPGPIIVNESLVPRGRVIAGRVTSASGAPLSGGVGIYRQTSSGWVSIDDTATHGATGRWSYTVPAPGRYQVYGFVDHYRARWATSANHRSAGRIITVGVSTTFINGVDIHLPYCPGPTDAICVPPGFNS
jgi:hypothetical protein